MAYLRIAKDSKYSFLLESVIAGENVARYSFIGAGVFSMTICFIFYNLNVLTVT
jgi:anthranilate synthase component 1